MMDRFAVDAADGWTHWDAGCLGMVSGVPVGTLNGVLVGDEQFDAAVVARLLDEVAATGLPYSLQVRPACVSAATELSGTRSLHRDEYDVPLMVLEDPGRLDVAQSVDALVIRELAPSEGDIHARVAAEGFEAPFELFQQLATPSMLSAPGVRCYVGEVAGVPVTTGVSLTQGSYVSIFNIATPPAYRGNGYGAAVTARAVSDGLAGGAAWAWLLASPSGFPIYERLGFRTVESWSYWLSADEPEE
jgi:ribosomal protein S18 acetylase RimI-like enzyme